MQKLDCFFVKGNHCEYFYHCSYDLLDATIILNALVKVFITYGRWIPTTAVRFDDLCVIIYFHPFSYLADQNYQNYQGILY